MDINKILDGGGAVIKNPDKKSKREKKKPDYITVPYTKNNSSSVYSDVNAAARYNSIFSSVTNPRKYTDYGITIAKPNIGKLDYEIAEAQSGWTKFGNSLVQSLSEAVIGTGRGFSDLFGAAYDLLTGEIFKPDYNYTNEVSQLLQGWQDDIKNNIAPIYTNPDVDILHGGLLSGSWYAKNFPTVFTTLSLLIPARAVSMGLSKAGRGITKATTALRSAREAKALRALQDAETAQASLNATRVAARTGDDIKINGLSKFLFGSASGTAMKAGARLIGEAGMMRVMENYQESSQVWSDVYSDTANLFNQMADTSWEAWKRQNRELIEESGLTNPTRDDMAKYIAKRSATRTFNIDAANLTFDIIQLMGLRDMGRLAKNIKGSKSLRRLQRESINNIGKGSDELVEAAKNVSRGTKIKNAIADTVLGGAKIAAMESTEGIEEIVNYIAQREGMTFGDLLLSRENELTLMSPWNRLKEYSKDPQLFESGFWGVMGGFLFGVGGNALNKYTVKKDNERRRREAEARGENLNVDSPASHWISLWDTQEVKAGKEAILNRSTRYEELVRNLNLIRNENKNPWEFEDKEKTKHKEFKNDIERDMAEARVKSDYITNLVLDAKNSGTYKWLISYLNNENVQNALGRLAGENEGTKEFIDGIVNKAERISDMYDKELNRVDAQVAAINMRHPLKSRIPVQYVQLIAFQNIEKDLTIENIRLNADVIEKNIQDKLNSLYKDANSPEEIKEKAELDNRLRAIVQLSYLTDLYGRNEALRKSYKEGKQLDNSGRPMAEWMIAAEVKKIDALQKDVLNQIREFSGKLAVQDANKKFENELNKWASLIGSMRYGKSYIVQGKEFKRRLNISAEEAKQRDEEIIKTLEKMFGAMPIAEGSDRKATMDIVNQLADKAVTDMENEASSTGLRGKDEELYKNYSELAYWKMAELQERNAKVITQQQVSDAVNNYNNIYNTARADALTAATNIIINLFDKYSNDNTRNALYNIITSERVGDHKQAVNLARQHFTKLDENNKKESEKLIDALNVLNFNFVTNDEVYFYLLEVIRKEQERFDSENRGENIDTEGVDFKDAKKSSSKNKNLPQSQRQQRQVVVPPQQQQGSDGSQNGSTPSLFVGIETSAENNITKINVSDTQSATHSIPAYPTNNTNEYELDVANVKASDNEDENNNVRASLLSNKNLFDIPGDAVLTDAQLNIDSNPIIRAEGGNITIVSKGVLSVVTDDEEDDGEDFGSISPTGIQPVVQGSGNTQGGTTNEATIGETSQEVAAKKSYVNSKAKKALDDSGSFDDGAIRTKVKQEIAADEAHRDKITEAEIDSILDEHLPKLERYWQRHQNAKNTLDSSVNDTIMNARTEEVDTFSSAFETSVGTMIDEISKILGFPTVNGKKTASVRAILFACKEYGELSDDELVTEILPKIIAYLYSDEGRRKYNLVDPINSINQAYKALTPTKPESEGFKGSEELWRVALYSDEDSVFDEIDESSDILIPGFVSEEPQVTNDFINAFKTLKVGDRLNIRRDAGYYFLDYGSTPIGYLPLPGSTGDAYVMYNDGWRYEISRNAQGRVESPMLSIFNEILFGDNNDWIAIRNLLFDVKSRGGFKNLDNVTKEFILDAFAKNPAIRVLVENSKEGAIQEIDEDIVIKGKLVDIHGDSVNKGYVVNYERLFKHLYNIFDYVQKKSVESLDSYNTKLKQSIYNWFDKLYNTYDFLATLPDNVTEVEVGNLISGEIIQNTDKPKDNYNALLFPSEAIAPSTVVRLGVAKPGNTQTGFRVSRETKTDSQGICPTTLNGVGLLSYTERNTPDFIYATGTNIDSINQQTTPLLWAIHRAARLRLMEAIDGCLTDPTKNINTVLGTLLSTFRSNFNGRAVNDRIPLFSLIEQGFIDVQSSFANAETGIKTWQGFRIMFTNNKDNSVLYCDFFTSTSTASPGFSIRRVINGRTENITSYVSPRTGRQTNFIFCSNYNDYTTRHRFIKTFVNTMMTEVQKMTRVNIDYRGVDGDNNTFTPTRGFISYEGTGLDRKLKLSIPTSSDEISVNAEFDDYNDYIISNNLVKVNTRQENGSNYTSKGNSPYNNANLKVRFRTSSPVRSNPPALASDFEAFMRETNPDGSPIVRTGQDIARTLLGDDVMDELDRAAKAAGIPKVGEDLFPQQIIFNPRLNIFENNKWSGNLAETNVGTTLVNTGHEYVNGERKSKHLAPKTAYIGPRWLDLSRRLPKQAVRKLMHENLHIKLKELYEKVAKEKGVADSSKTRSELLKNFDSIIEYVWNDIVKVYKDLPKTGNAKVDALIDHSKGCYNAIAAYIYNGKFTDRFKEEFIVEAMTSSNFYQIMNSIQVADSTTNTKETLFTKFLRFIANFFGWTINDNTLYKKFFNTLRNLELDVTSVATPGTNNLFDDRQDLETGNETLDEINKKPVITQEDIDKVDALDIQKPAGCSDEMSKAIDEVNEYKRWQASHVHFDEPTHTYSYVDDEGVMTDTEYTVTGYIDEKNGGNIDTEERKVSTNPASVIGTEVDSITRHYFMGLDVRKINYPNLVGRRKETIIKSLDKLKARFDSIYGKGKYIVITNDIKLIGKFIDGNGDERTIGGAMDMLVITEDGRKELYDMKAKKGDINHTYNGVSDRQVYTKQQNGYRQLSAVTFGGNDISKMQLIWFYQSYPSNRDGAQYRIDDDGTINIIIGNRTSKLSESDAWVTPELRSFDDSAEDSEKSLITLNKENLFRAVKPYESTSSDDTTTTPETAPVPETPTTPEDSNAGANDDLISINDEDLIFIESDDEIYDDNSLSDSNIDYSATEEVIAPAIGEFNLLSLNSITSAMSVSDRQIFLDRLNSGEINYKCE